MRMRTDIRIDMRTYMCIDGVDLLDDDKVVAIIKSERAWDGVDIPAEQGSTVPYVHRQ